MDSEKIRSRIIKYIEHADERVLRIFNDLIDKNSSPSSGHEKRDAPIEHQQHKTDNEKGQEEGMGKPKDDHRLK